MEIIQKSSYFETFNVHLNNSKNGMEGLAVLKLYSHYYLDITLNIKGLKIIRFCTPELCFESNIQHLFQLFKNENPNFDDSFLTIRSRPATNHDIIYIICDDIILEICKVVCKYKNSKSLNTYFADFEKDMSEIGGKQNIQDYYTYIESVVVNLFNEQKRMNRSLKGG